MTGLRFLDTAREGFDAELARLLEFETTQDAAVEAAVAAIIADVRARGDAAVLDHTRRLDRVMVDDIADLEVRAARRDRALAALPDSQRRALTAAAGRVREYHEKQRAQSWSFKDADGNELGQQVSALDRVGIYVPGGKAAYPSTVIMNAVPARVAGVREIVMTVPAPGGELSDLVLAAAAICGVDRVITIGGAQAIAALAYGTQSIRRVDKIVGPGNAYVASAKRQVFGVVGIDMLAGPSEVLVVSDGSASADWIAMDLFAQAEHDELAQALLLSPDGDHLDAVAASVERLLATMPRRTIIAAALARRGAFVRVRDLAQACEIANRVAPEHLELAVADPRALLPRIRHAGAIFLGSYSSEALGDYCAGPNHVLPTSGSARFSSPLGVYDFQKRSSVIAISRAGARALGAIASELARGEGLTAHAVSAEYRMEKGNA
jgi:histidinol dehydrogenase